LEESRVDGNGSSGLFGSGILSLTIRLTRSVGTQYVPGAVTIPDFQTIMRPLLVLLEDGQERTSTEIRAALASEFALTEAELAEMIPSGRAKTFANRVAWAMTHMYQAGLLERPRRSVYRITPRGTEVLAAQPDRVDLKILAQFQEYREFRTKGGPSNAMTTTGSELELITSDQTPEEQIGAAYESVRSALVADLLEREPTAMVAALSSRGF
jgi:restriction system protein